MPSSTYKDEEIQQEDLLYTGKAKQLFSTSNPDIYWLHYLDSATALNGKVKEEYAGKGELNAQITRLLFQALDQAGITHHLLKTVSPRDQLVERVEIIPLEVVTRNVAAGHLVSRFGLKGGEVLTPPIREIYYKSDPLDDPFMNDSQAISLKIASQEELETLYQMADQVNDCLKAVFDEIGITLVDFKLEFGRRSRDGKLILADELSPDNMRLVDHTSGQSLDKDVFRQHKGDLRAGYREILNRLEKLF
ncbi:phosphoribosylaminoimidazolesuccinocarboxamide synthase [Eupransor demetentiae]|uniref:Phosphoribosylaminoimidazole-succinocarboxamide synthase n=1 Tax=Eupransor demetentiae TaxID=3109584 RepID=A0ABM9N418_9LACO|nr:Phosphoribosylaminoimidazole-succinocarboxamide synthase (PurC) [Lactobacillaceae bacterium LMG 33000]